MPQIGQRAHHVDHIGTRASQVLREVRTEGARAGDIVAVAMINSLV